MLNEEMIARGTEKGYTRACIKAMAVGMVLYSIGLTIWLKGSDIVEWFQDKFSKKNKYTTCERDDEE
jgi:hypothetical protein